MSWTDTHRYYSLLRDVEAELDRSPGAALPWRAEHQAVFGTPRRLLDALRLRWARLVQAQVEEGTWGGDLVRLSAEHPGLVRLLARDRVESALASQAVPA